MNDIKIRRLLSAAEHDQAVELQKSYWGEDAAYLVPRHMLHSVSHYGGHVLGAFDGDGLVGLVIGFIGTDIDIDAPDARPAMANLLIMSKRMAVLPAYRGRNIGFRLKMAQRDIAMKQAIRLVTWTVDPLLAANAHLNIRKLGAVIQRFSANYFGLDAPDSLRADRLIVEWWVAHRRVTERAAGRGSRLALKQYLDVHAPIVNRADASGDWLKPRSMTDVPGSSFALVEIPADFRELEAAHRSLADQWRYHIRDVFSRMLTAGFVVTDFVSGQYEGRTGTFYLLSRHFDVDDRKN
jgi:predicted GNAT superfamily acetyltransferase